MRGVLSIWLVGAFIAPMVYAGSFGVAKNYDEMRQAYYDLCREVEYAREREGGPYKTKGVMTACVCRRTHRIAYYTTFFYRGLEIGRARAAVYEFARQFGGCTGSPVEIFTKSSVRYDKRRRR